MYFFFGGTHIFLLGAQLVPLAKICVPFILKSTFFLVGHIFLLGVQLVPLAKICVPFILRSTFFGGTHIFLLGAQLVSLAKNMCALHSKKYLFFWWDTHIFVRGTTCAPH